MLHTAYLTICIIIVYIFTITAYPQATEKQMEDSVSSTISIVIPNTHKHVNVTLGEITLAGVVFDNPDAYKTDIPHNISYTIR